jgi:hypothetical protein
MITLFSGCMTVAAVGAAGAATGAGVAYAKGDLEDTIHRPPAEVARAALLAFSQLKIAKESLHSTSEEIVIKGVTAGDHSVTIKIFEEPTLLEYSHSKISIRTGIFGDDRESRKILNAINRNLKL